MPKDEDDVGRVFLLNDFKYQKNSQLLLKKFPRKS